MIAGFVGVISLALVAWLGVGRLQELRSSEGKAAPPEQAAPADEPEAPGEDVESRVVSAQLPVETSSDPAAQGSTGSSARTPATRRASVVTTSAPAPVAAKASPAANVLVKGGVSVVLEQQGRKVTVPGVVAPGKYRILATFDGALEPAGTVTVPATGRVTITCDASTLMCASATEP